MTIERGGISIPVGADLKPLEKGLKKAEGLTAGFSERIRRAASGAIWDGSSFVSGLRMSSKNLINLSIRLSRRKKNTKI